MLCKNTFDNREVNSKKYVKSSLNNEVKAVKNTNPFITGIVVAAGWDHNGNVVLISIQGYDEKEYVVQMNRCGEELMEFINRKVNVYGTVSKRLDGKHLIQVDQYDLL
jgi:hypothetical protein